MAAALRTLRPVYVVGIGLHPYGRQSDTSFVTLGLTAVRAALADAAIAWPEVEAAYVGTALLGMAPGRAILRYLGTTGIPITQVENASASGSTAFRLACLEVAAGISDCALALGVDKPAPFNVASRKSGIASPDGGQVAPATHFALLANAYQMKYGASDEDIARVAVKNSRNGALNPNAQRQKARDLAEVMAGPPIAGSLTRLQCCPIGEGAAAVIVASEPAVQRLGIDTGRAVRVLSSSLKSERLYAPDTDGDAALTAETVRAALDEAALAPDDLDVVELHDAFSIEELVYAEAIGLCGDGEAAAALNRGDFDIGGRCALSASGGLLAMGHPIGPTGVGQIAEITRQLRGEAGPRQQPNARYGLAHMVGIGAVCAVHVLASANAGD